MLSDECTVVVKIVSVDLKSLVIRLLCGNCKEDVVCDEGLVLCNNCDNMSTEEDCLRKSNVAFTGAFSASKINFIVTRSLVNQCFGTTDTTSKIQVAKSMLKSDVEATYNKIDNVISVFKKV